MRLQHDLDILSICPEEIALSVNKCYYITFAHSYASTCNYAIDGSKLNR